MGALFEALSNVSPSFASHNQMDCADGESKLLGKLGLTRFACVKQSTNFYNLLRLESGVWMQFSRAAGITVSSLRHHIVGVILRCSQKQVRWVNARGIIAAVANKRAVWNWPVVQFPRQAMGVNKMFVSDYSPIALFRNCPPPFPTFIWAALVCFLPKAANEGLAGTSAHMMSGDKAHGMSFDDSHFPISAFRNRRGLPAATLAELDCRGFRLWLFWGMILHGISSSIASVRAGAVSAAPGFSIGATGVIVAQNGSIG